jgi:hypothetical protein
MNKIVVALLLCLVSASWSRAAEAPAAEPTPMAKAVAAIKLKPKWERIEIDKDEPRSYSLTLHYKPVGREARRLSPGQMPKWTPKQSPTPCSHN